MANPELRSSLSAALASVHLEDRLDKAHTWCEENGAWELKELIDKEIFADFSAEIGLKRLEAKRLLTAFMEAVGVEEPSDSSPSAAPSKDISFAAAFGAFPGGMFPGQGYGVPGGQAVVVKNTFLDWDRPQSDLLGNRAQTLPINFHQDALEEEDEEDDDEEGAAEAEAESEGKISSPQASVGSGSAPPTAGSSSLLKEKLTTFDAWESGAYWDWQGGDPNCNAPTASAPQNETTSSEPVGAAAAAVSTDMPAPTMFVQAPMWGMPPMMFPMMPMMMDVAAQAQMQMAMAGGMMSAGEGTLSGPVAEPKPRSQVMERLFSATSQRERIRWTVDARKLKSSDREAVSPTFEVSCGGMLKFKMVLKPKVMDSQKGGACFKKSRNKGYVELRCVTELESETHVKPILTFRLQVGSAKRSEAFRGPLRHNFAERAICGLPEGQDEWDFGKVVDHSNNTFGIVLELLKDDS